MKKNAFIVMLILVIAALVIAVSCSLTDEPNHTDEADKIEDEKQLEDNDISPAADISVQADTVTSAAESASSDTNGSLPSLSNGSYVLGYIIGGDEYNEHDINIQIHDNGTGSFYISDAQHNRFEAKDFTYTDADGVITFHFDTGEKQVYQYMPTDNDEIVLRDNSAGVDYHFYKPYDYLFTAIGSWMTVRQDGTHGYICYWEDGTGYAINWEHAEQMVTFDWYYDYGVLQIPLHNHQGYFEEVFVDHYGNVTELTYPSLDYTQVLYRAEGDIMYGNYMLEDTDASDIIVKELNLSENWDAQCTVNKNGQDVVYDNASWHIDIMSGKMSLNIYHEGKSIKMVFDYFYGGDKLILRDAQGYSFGFVKDSQ